MWTADFDLLARMPGSFDSTSSRRSASWRPDSISGSTSAIFRESTSGAGRRERPVQRSKSQPRRRATRSRSIHTYRDREEELVGFARSLESASSRRSNALPSFSATAALPLFGAPGSRQRALPYQATDSLPLAGEPFVAGLDVAFAFLGSEGTRATTIELLGSPQWRFADPADGRPLERADVSALDGFFRETKYLGGWDRLRETAQRLSDETAGGRHARLSRVAAALRAAAAAADELGLVSDGTRASEQIAALEQFIARRECVPQEAESVAHAPPARPRCRHRGPSSTARGARAPRRRAGADSRSWWRRCGAGSRARRSHRAPGGKA